MKFSTAHFSHVLTLDVVIEWLREHAPRRAVSPALNLQQHALQCAQLAQDAGASPELVVAALLHDISRAVDSGDAAAPVHADRSADLLRVLFPAAVTEPIRLHVDAKRYLCHISPAYRAALSDASCQSLALQGGPFAADDARAFILQPFARQAVRLRRWDDAAKVAGAATSPLEHFIPVLESVAHAARRASEEEAI